MIDGFAWRIPQEKSKTGDANLLGPDVTLIHLSGITERA
jgi:hypothetical protein